MKVKDVVTLVKDSYLRNLNIKDDQVIINYIYLALVELNRRFNLSIKSEVVHAYPDLSVYELRESDVDMLLGVYTSDNCELRESDVLNDKDAKFKILNYNSFIYNTDIEEDLVCIYKTSPNNDLTMDSVLYIPNSMLSALGAYVAYLGYSTIGSDVNSQRESDRLYKLYNIASDTLEGNGYRVNISNESLYGQVKGYA